MPAVRKEREKQNEECHKEREERKKDRKKEENHRTYRSWSVSLEYTPGLAANCARSISANMMVSCARGPGGGRTGVVRWTAHRTGAK